MKEPLLDNIPDFEAAYLQMKKKLYVEFFKIMTVLFFIPLIVETARALIDLKTSILPALITAIIVTASLVKIIWSLKKYQELGMTIFCFGSCAFLLAVNPLTVSLSEKNQNFIENGFDFFSFRFI